jgi:hypothetical protein
MRSIYPKITADGRYVAFVSYSTNFYVGDTNITPDIFRYDKQNHVLQHVVIPLVGPYLNSQDVEVIDLSDDGNIILFKTDATNISG